MVSVGLGGVNGMMAWISRRQQPVAGRAMQATPRRSGIGGGRGRSRTYRSLVFVDVWQQFDIVMIAASPCSSSFLDNRPNPVSKCGTKDGIDFRFRFELPNCHKSARRWRTWPGQRAAIGEDSADRQERGLYADGKGLYLRIGPTGAKSWIYRYRSDGQRHDLGLGPYPDISLADARERATAQRKLRLNGDDPLQARRAGRDQVRLAAARGVPSRRAPTRPPLPPAPGRMALAQSLTAWEGTLGAYVCPIFGALPVQAVDTARHPRRLSRSRNANPETAGRVRGGSKACSIGPRRAATGTAKTRRAGATANLLPQKSKVRRVETPCGAALSRDWHLHGRVAPASCG